MLNVKTGLYVGKFLLGVFLVAGLAAPALAGNVWSWRTEDGTYSFTDDPKRIPANYRKEAKKKTMGKMTRYERFTKVSSDSEKPYADRIRERQSELRSMAVDAPRGAVAGAMQVSGTGMEYDIPVSGGRGRGATVSVPLEGGRMDSDQPTTIESIRVKPRKSMATRHWTLIQQDGRPTTVIKGELRQRPLKSKSESDFDF